jgi:hypothetical protein
LLGLFPFFVASACTVTPLRSRLSRTPKLCCTCKKHWHWWKEVETHTEACELHQTNAKLSLQRTAIALLMCALPSVPLSSLLAVARRPPCSWPAIDTCSLCLPSRIAPAGIRPPPARLDMQHARPYGSIMPLRVAITRTSKYARTAPALAKSPEPLLFWVVLWLWPCPSTKHMLLTF